MVTESIRIVSEFDSLIARIERHIARNELRDLAQALAEAAVPDLVAVFERLPERELAVAFRMLSKQRALEVFEAVPPALQGDLVHALQDAEVAALFAGLDPDDRVWLLDELPAAIATRLLRGLPPRERELTASVLGYPRNAIGRRMSPEVLTTRGSWTVEQTLTRVRNHLDDAETVYTIPVIDHERRVVGVVSLRDLLRAEPGVEVESLMSEPETVPATLEAELAARRCADSKHLALPIVDSESRLVGVLTIDDAIRILEDAESEDAARQGGVEPLRRPYFTTPVFSLVRSRIVWLLFLAVGATLTVQVLSHFEDELARVTALALFVPLLIGTGGNTGNQAATTVTRALALGDVRPQDIARVLGREVRVGVTLGALLGALGFGIATAVFDFHLGLIIGLTLLCVCTVAAALGGIMPLIAKAVRVDPAVFSNPFISTFVDATGLIIYFFIAKAVLGL